MIEQITIFDILIVILVIASVLFLQMHIRHWWNKCQTRRKRVYDTYNPYAFDFKNSKKKVILVIYKIPGTVDVVPFDSFLAATQWALMIVHNSRSEWQFPAHLSDLDLLKDWTNYTDGKEFIMINEFPIKHLKRKRSL